MSTANTSFLSVAEVAEMLSVNAITVRRIIKSGKLLTHRVGHLLRISREDLETYLAKVRN